MSSSISAQLQQLRTATTETIDRRINESAKATRKSLLYSEKDAAKLDFNKLFELAVSGVDELINSHAVEIEEDVYNWVRKILKINVEEHLFP